MGGFTGWIRAAVVVGGALTVTACSTYPSEPRYSTRPMPVGGQGGYPAQPQQPGAYPNNNPYYAQPAQPQTPPPASRPYEEQGPRGPSPFRSIRICTGVWKRRPTPEMVSPCWMT